MRLPVAAKNALSTAGAATKIVGSPTRPPLHQGKASNASPKGNPDNQAGNGGKGDGHGDTTGQTWNANLLARFNDGPLMNGEMCLEPLSALGRINGRQAVTGRLRIGARKWLISKLMPKRYGWK
jgi:hypothetical protein